MIRRPQRVQEGFTVIELLVVAVILCILGAIVVFGYSGVQAKNRNQNRRLGIDAIKTQLESYYFTNNTYPTQEQLSDPAWRAKNLPHVSQSAITDPRWSARAAACSHSNYAIMAAQPAPNCYSYQVTDSAGSPCDNTHATCAHYTLTATLEGGGKYVRSSLN